MKEQYTVTGMTCAACSAAVERAVNKLPGVEKAEVNLLDGSMVAEYDPDKTNAAAIVQAVEKAGYGASLNTPRQTGQPAAAAEDPAQRQEKLLQGMKKRLAVSIVFLVPLMWVSMGHMMGLPLPGFLSGTEGAIPFALTQFLLVLPIMYVNRKYYQTGLRTLAHGSPNMDSLIAIGSLAAVAYGIFALYRMGWAMGTGDLATVEKYHMDLYFESAGTILTLITVGKFLETRAKGKTGAAIRALLDLAPKTAIVRRNGVDTEIPVEQVEAGDTVVIKPGMRIPVDGTVLDGISSVDESAITGESIPVEKAPGDKVIGATINKSGSFVFRAEKVGADTTLSQIVELVRQAGAGKAPIAKLADKVSGVFVPAVIAIALVSFVVWLAVGQSFEFALSRGIAVLVISCPCALGLATPVAIMVGTGKAAKFGVLFHNAEALENAHHIDTIVLDKTGTITQGKPQLTDLAPVEGLEANQLLQAAAGLELPSEHPLAEAIVEYARQQNLEIQPAEQFTAIPGKGLQAVWQGQTWLAGNARLMEERGIELGQARQLADDLAAQGKTPLYFAQGRQLAGVIAVADVVKPTSAAAIREFARMGVDVWMLTGDNARTAAAIQQQLDIPHVKAEVLPQDKEQMVRQLQQQGKKVAMVGDGINDAPALVRADVGIAIGAGTDVAIQSADVVLMKSDLWDVVTTLRLSRSVIRNIKENLFWAFFYNAVGIPLAAGALWSVFHLALNPMFGAAAMSLSSVCVVSNALRLNWFRSAAPQQQIAENKQSAVAVTTLPAPQPVQQDKEEKGLNVTLKIQGMMCNNCVRHVTKALQGVAGVQTVEVNLEEGTARVTADETASVQTMQDAVTEEGYTVTGVE